MLFQFPAHRASRSIIAMALAGICVSTVPAVVRPAAGQQSQPSLAELAKKEAERRKTAKDAKKVITTKDLPESARRPAPAPAAADAGATHAGEQKPPSGSATPAPAAGAGDAEAAGESYWRSRITQAREGLRRNEAFLQALQTRVNSLSNDFYSRDDPIQRGKIAEDRKTALQEMERVKADIELSKKQIDDIEEEARKAGVPPGWLR